MNAIRRFFKRQDAADELADEIAGHIEEKARVLMAGGLSNTGAREEARRAFGNVTAAAEMSREAWGWNAAEDLWKDLCYAGRVLRKSPAFTFTAITVLALGIGMNTAIFSAVKAVLLSRLPYPEPERLMDLSQIARDGHRMSVSGPDARDWRDQNTTFASMATYASDSVAVSGGFTPRQIGLGVVSESFFRTLGLEPLIGRTFGADERKPGGQMAALISYNLAAGLFGSAGGTMNRTVRVNGLLFTIIGIMPPGFDFPSQSQLWIAQEAFPENNSRSAHNYRVIGRLTNGMTVSGAQADMNVIATRLARAYADDKEEGIRVTSLYDELIGPFRPAFVVLLCSVACVLLIACVNISNLQLARGAVRVREMALRTALGAARGRLIRQLLTESVLLSIVGGAAGLLLALGGCALLRHYAPAEIPRIENIRIDATVLGFSMVLSVAAGVVFGLLPAVAASRADVNDALKEATGKSTPGPRMKTWGNLLVVGQVGLAVILLAGAALLLRSLWKLDHVDSGLRSADVFATTVTWPTADGDSVDGPQVAQLSKQMLERIKALPGVQAAGMINTLPVQEWGSDGDFEIEGVPSPADPHDYADAWHRAATSGYFQAFGLPILAGRNFTEGDDRSTEQVAIVNQTFVKTFFKSSGALGRRIRFLGFDRKPKFMTIVGIVSDVHALGLKKPAGTEVFVDYLQHADASLSVHLVVQGGTSTQRAVRGIISELNHDTPIEFEAMNSVLSSSMSREHFQTVLLSLFAGFALLLAAVGIYGVLSYTVSRRTSELGIRMALGARQTDVLGLVLREGVSLAGSGLVIGLLCAPLCTRALSSLLFGVTSSDPAAFLVIAVIFSLVALLGCYIPARRAANISPTVALRYE